VDQANCPSCGRGNLLAHGVVAIQLARSLAGGRVYGSPAYLPVLSDSPVVCNYSDCGWQGALGDLA
jgi:hypothetical protein